MKKAKFLLAGVAMLAVLGTGLAFKSAKAVKTTYYTTTAANPNAQSLCNIAVQATITTGASLTSWATDEVGGGDCANITITTKEGL